MSVVFYDENGYCSVVESIRFKYINGKSRTETMEKELHNDGTTKRNDINKMERKTIKMALIQHVILLSGQMVNHISYLKLSLMCYIYIYYSYFVFVLQIDHKQPRLLILLKRFKKRCDCKKQFQDDGYTYIQPNTLTHTSQIHSLSHS